MFEIYQQLLIGKKNVDILLGPSLQLIVVFSKVLVGIVSSRCRISKGAPTYYLTFFAQNCMRIM